MLTTKPKTLTKYQLAATLTQQLMNATTAGGTMQFWVCMYFMQTTLHACMQPHQARSGCRQCDAHVHACLQSHQACVHVHVQYKTKRTYAHMGMHLHVFALVPAPYVHMHMYPCTCIQHPVLLQGIHKACPLRSCPSGLSPHHISTAAPHHRPQSWYEPAAEHCHLHCHLFGL